jgi:RNA polymerase-binding transcription factor DksA
MMMARAQVLSRRELRELKAELLSERRRLERSMDVDTYADESLWTAGGDVTTPPASGAGGGVQTRTNALYDAIVNALQRLETGDYGKCVACDRPIPYGRLLVMPEALHCITCGSRA